MAGRLVRILGGEDRVSHGWGWLTLFTPAALALFLFQLAEGQQHPPHHFAWVWPVIWVCVVASLLGLYLLLAPMVRRHSRPAQPPVNAELSAFPVNPVGIRQTGGTSDHENPTFIGYDVAVDHQGGEMRMRGARFLRDSAGVAAEEEGGPVHPPEAEDEGISESSSDSD